MTQTIRHEPKSETISFASLRCSRPLCSSQNTGGIFRHPNQSLNDTKIRRPSHLTVQLAQRSVTASLTNAGRSLRTQQRAKDQVHSPELFQPANKLAGVLTSGLFPGHNVNVPPMSATGEHVSPKWLRGLIALYTDASSSAP